MFVQLIRGDRQTVRPRRSKPCASMLTINGGFSFWPDLRPGGFGQGKSQGWRLFERRGHSRKITSTISTSINAT